MNGIIPYACQTLHRRVEESQKTFTRLDNQVRSMSPDDTRYQSALEATVHEVRRLREALEAERQILSALEYGLRVTA